MANNIWNALLLPSVPGTEELRFQLLPRPENWDKGWAPKDRINATMHLAKKQYY